MGKTVAAGIFLIRKDKKLLICHPTKHKPDFWSIPKGKVEEGETMHEAAIRETYEETNLYLDKWPNMEIHELFPVDYKHKKKVLYPFVYIETDDSSANWDLLEIKCNSNVSEERGGFPEMDEYKWVTIEEARPLLHETQSYCLDEIKQILG